MPSCRIAGLLILFSTTYSVGQTATSVPCLSYEPVVVKIAGTLGRKTVPGPPNYENIRNGDRPETYWFVKLSRPVCVGEDEKGPALNPAKKNVGSIQLVLCPGRLCRLQGTCRKKGRGQRNLIGSDYRTSPYTRSADSPDTLCREPLNWNGTFVGVSTQTRRVPARATYRKSVSRTCRVAAKRSTQRT